MTLRPRPPLARWAAVTVGAALAVSACAGGSTPTASAPPSAPPSSTVPDPTATAAPPLATPSSTTVAVEPTPPPSAEPVTLAFGGDVNAVGSAAPALDGGLSAIAPLLSAADVTMVNLETAITDRGTQAPKEFAFRTSPRLLTALQAAGVDVVTLANNHGMDFGQVGLADTLAAAREVGLPLVGAGEDVDAAFAPHVVEVRGQRIALIGATQVLDSNVQSAWTATATQPGLASAKDEPRLVAEVRAARAVADTVVVYLHWGKELDACPLPRQQSLARALAAAGADVIVGGHAHVLQGGGLLDGAYVHYGLGNFVFASRRDASRATGVLTLTLRGRTVESSTWNPALITGGIPAPLDGAAAERARAEWEALRGCSGLADPPS